ncbi:MAG: ABC transporter substrate-binding protein [Kurthia sp.]|nr:ABC transporter substrate-binding protein [Candidatus Kurthia equi]
MKKIFNLNFLLLLVVSVLLVGCGKDNAKEANADGKVTVRAAIDTAAGGSFQIRAANTNDDFLKNKLDVKLSNFAYGIDTVNAVLTKQADTGLAADYALLNSLNRGDFVVVSSLTGSDKDFNSVSLTEILAVKGIDKPANIKGKKIGVAKGTVSEYHWAKYLEHYGISEKDVKYIPYSTPDEAIVGVKKGDMDVVLGSGALIEKFKSIDGVHEIDRLSSVPDLNIASYLIVDRAFAQANTEAITGFIKGIEKGIEFVESNPDGTADIAYEELKVTKEDVLLDLKRQNFTLGFTKEDYEHLTKMKAYLLEKGILKEDYDLDAKLFLEPAKQAVPDAVTY